MIKRIMERHEGGIEDGIEGLKEAAKEVKDANCIFGVRMSSTTISVPKGTFIHYTYHASVAFVRVV